MRGSKEGRGLTGKQRIQNRNDLSGTQARVTMEVAVAVQSAFVLCISGFITRPSLMTAVC